MNPLLELARVEHASRVASLSAHRRRSALMELLRRRAQAFMAEVEESAPAVEVIGRPAPDQTQPSAASEAPAEMAPPWAD